MSLFSSIGKIFKKIAPIAQIAAPFIPGVGGIVAGLAGRFTTPEAAQVPSQFLRRAGGVPLTLAGGPLPLPGASALSMVRGLPKLGAGALARSAGVARTTTGKIRGVFRPDGKFVSRKNMVKLAKQIGLEAAATALAITAIEMATAIQEEISKPRRRRGISGRDLATARRVQRQILSSVKQLQCVGSVSVRKSTASCCK